MKNFINKYLILLLIFSSVPNVYARDFINDQTKICGEYIYNIENFLTDRSIDLSTRSVRGWMRVLNSKEKLYYYGLSNCDKNDIKFLKVYIKETKTKQNKNYDRRLR